jgi:predicted RNase H-like HicB family nuclease
MVQPAALYFFPPPFRDTISTLNVKDAIRIIERDGWVQVRQKRKPPAVSSCVEARHGDRRRSSGWHAASEDVGYNQKAGRSQMKYAVIYETGPGGGYSAYVPDLPGCVACADTLEQTRPLIEEAIEFHIEGKRLHGETIPPPSSVAEMREIAPVA